MSKSFQDDGESNFDEPADDVEAITLFVEDAIEEIEGIIAGLDLEMESPQEGIPPYLSTNVGSVAKSYLNLWKLALEHDEGILSEKTTLAEFLLFVAEVQARMDLNAQGGEII